MCLRYSRIIFPLVLIVLFPWTFSNAQDVVRVERVVYGDTLLLTNGEKVRLIGIDCPESRPNRRAEKQSESEGKDLKTIISICCLPLFVFYH